MKKLIIRLDDISWDMNYDNFEKGMMLLLKHDIHPIIGVIPQNRDDTLVAFRQESEKKISEEEFWPLIRKLQNENGWEMALHGCYHLYTTSDSGFLQINSRSEFAGLSYDEQCELISRGKSILEKHGIKPITFMAPAHSFDETTIRALRDNGLTSITDGIALFPYVKHECLFVPQVGSAFVSFGVGYSTVCIHLNEWGGDRFRDFDEFLTKYRGHFMNFSDAIKDFQEKGKFYWKVYNLLYRGFYFGRRKLSRLKHGFIDWQQRNKE